MGTNNKLREALKAAKQYLDGYSTNILELRRKVDSALAEPVKNCEVGTPKEQENRWQTNCGHGIPNCKHCKVYEEAKNSGLVNSRYFMRCDCRFIWAQMPYEESKAKGN